MGDWLALLGRLLIAFVFLCSALMKCREFRGTVDEMKSVNVPFSAVLLLGALFFEFVGIFCVLLGAYVEVGAALLVIFLIAVTLAFHRDLGDRNHLFFALANVGIVGGLLILAANGPGAFALGW